MRKHKFENDLYDSCYYNKVELPVSTVALQNIYRSNYQRSHLGPDTTATVIGLAVSIYDTLKRIKGGVVGYSTHRVIVLFGVRPVRHKG